MNEYLTLYFPDVLVQIINDYENTEEILRRSISSNNYKLTKELLERKTIYDKTGKSILTQSITT